jgi:hypothetical protein
MIASVLQTHAMLKVIAYSLLAGVGIAVVFGAGVSSVAGLVEARRERRSAATAGWGVLAAACMVGAVGAVVLGIVVIAG